MEVQPITGKPWTCFCPRTLALQGSLEYAMVNNEKFWKMWWSSRAMAVTVLNIFSVQMFSGCPTWGINAVVSLTLEKALYQWKIVQYPSHSSLVCALCINFKVTAADFCNQQQNFIIFHCSFFTSIFEDLNSRVVTKTIVTIIVVTEQWKVISRRSFDYWHKIDHGLHSAAWLRTAIGSLRSEANSQLFLDNFCTIKVLLFYWSMPLLLKHIFTIEVHFFFSVPYPPMTVTLALIQPMFLCCPEKRYDIMDPCPPLHIPQPR